MKKKSIKEILDKQTKINEKKYKKNDKPLTKQDWVFFAILITGFVILYGVIVPMIKS